MSFVPLSQHRHRFEPGKPAPYSIFDVSGRLLLARGNVLESAEQLERLVDREATIDPRELDDSARRIAGARPEELPGFWEDSIGAMSRLLRANASGGADFTGALDRASKPLQALIERDPDLAILLAVRHDASNPQAYASRHAVHTATSACVAAVRLGWSHEQVQCTLRVALTMNIAMAELQNKLAHQASPVTTLQRAEIRSHPERSAAMLEMAGVTDPNWLDAVRQHHEEESGTGYPNGLTAVNDVAKLVHVADCFTAKLSPRLTRQPMLADKAAREQYQRSPGDAMTAALIKEFGLYPPGCAVRLKSGELGMVIRRGESASTPVVAVLIDRNGDALLTPARRLTSKPEFTIVAVMPVSALKVRIGLEKLMVHAWD